MTTESDAETAVLLKVIEECRKCGKEDCKHPCDRANLILWGNGFVYTGDDDLQ
jgi:hypothetical protein